ncbi:MAG: hypothetical protein M3Y72_06425 [Acidobacteriota bacterium]|nr:hypothetical protein [Acidobacteriota bacterium]
MRKFIVSLLGVFVFCLLVVLARQAKSQDTNSGPAVQVRVHYTGTGTVDENHKIYVVLWDSPDFVEGKAMPVELKPTTSKNGTVTFSDVKKLPAYVSVAFDPNGGWDGKSGPPPEGSSLGLYSKEPGKPEPINVAASKQTTIEVLFDDTVKMHSGEPSRSHP